MDDIMRFFERSHAETVAEFLFHLGCYPFNFYEPTQDIVTRTKWSVPEIWYLGKVNNEVW